MPPGRLQGFTFLCYLVINRKPDAKPNPEHMLAEKLKHCNTMLLMNKNLGDPGYFQWVFIFLFSFIIQTTYAQNVPSNSVLKGADNIAGQINQIGDEAKAKYAENIDNPYIPTKINKEYTFETAQTMLTKSLKKYVNYYYASKVPAYKNLSENFTIKNIKNPEVTKYHILFTGGENHSEDTVYINYKDIINRQIIYYVKVTDGGFYMPYVKIGDHLLTCGGKEFADLIFYMQHQYAVKSYEEDLENFKTLASNYQKLSVKPEMSEEQRKLIVQGNTMNSVLNYDEAMAYYDKAIALNPLSSPESYYNYALIAALAEKYELAILNMKKYMLLLPEAEDLREAQDKIYEWEAMIQ